MPIIFGLLLFIPCQGNDDILAPSNNNERKNKGKHRATAATTVSYPYIIVGAGMSGLTAAKKLKGLYGADNVLVVDGRERIGGRVNTVKIGSTNAVIDIGASWIHGTEKNPLYPIATSLGLTVSHEIP